MATSTTPSSASTNNGAAAIQVMGVNQRHSQLAMAAHPFDELWEKIGSCRTKEAVFSLIGHMRGSHTKSLLQTSLGIIPKALTRLDPTVQTAAFVLLLNSHSGSIGTSMGPDHYFHLASAVLSGGQAWQLEAVMPEACTIARLLARSAVQLHAPLAAVRPLQRLVSVADECMPASLTPAHAGLALAACSAKLYKQVTSIPRALDLVVIRPDLTGVSIEDVLCYYLYLGIASCTMKKWQQALDSLDMCLICPGSAVSAVTVQAHRLRVLVGLIGKGAAPEPPRGVNSNVMRSLTRITAPYSEIADAFATLNAADLETAIAKHLVVLEADGLAGLARQALVAQRRQQILALTGTYLAVSLDEVVTKCRLRDVAQAEAAIVDLVASGMLRARIDHEKRIVAFEDAAGAHDPEEGARRMEELLRAATALSEAISSRDEDLALDPEFVASVAARVRLEPRGTSGGAGSAMEDDDDDRVLAAGTAGLGGFPH